MRQSAVMFGVAIAIVLASDAAHAQQTRPERPYRGLFGGGDTSSNMEQSLTMNGSVGAGYDTSVLANAAESGIGGGSSSAAYAPSQDGGFTSFSEGLAYSLNKSKVSLGASGSASERYYPTVNNSFISSYGGGLGASWSPTTRTHFSANQSVSYQPMNLYALFPVFGTTELGQPYLADLNYGTVDASYYTYRTSATASRQLSARAAFTADYSYDRSDYTLYPDFSSQNAGFRFTRKLSAGLGLRIGYNYTRTLYGNQQQLAGYHGLDTGVDYNKTLSFSRRTSLSFSTGGSATKYQGSTHFNAVGSATLNHEIGRTWQFNAAYNREVGFFETFGSPFLYDSARVSLGGLIDRRWSFHSSASVVLGALGFGTTASANRFTSYYADAGLSRALTRFVSLGVDYTFYRYGFGETPTLLPPGYTRDMNRNSVHATVNAWLPIFERGRRPNAAR
jgi:hypothetical protein